MEDNSTKQPAWRKVMDEDTKKTSVSATEVADALDSMNRIIALSVSARESWQVLAILDPHAFNQMRQVMLDYDARSIVDPKVILQRLLDEYLWSLRALNSVLTDTIGIAENIQDPLILDDLANPMWMHSLREKIQEKLKKIGEPCAIDRMASTEAQ